MPFLEAYQKALGNNEYYEQVLSVISILDEPVIKAKRLHGERWYEIDDVQDLDIATTLFAESEDERVSLLGARYGGYWRFPHLKDFCYLVNPYFPPARMMEELKSNFDILVRQYPSGMRVNCLLAAKTFGISEEHIVLGNGAAELIKARLEELPGKVGVIRPTFEEYPNRCSEQCVVYDARQNDFAYTAEDLIGYFAEHPVQTLVLINPDNPSGHCFGKKEVQQLLEWTKERRIALILDESFLDFAEDKEASLLTDEMLNRYPGLYIVKSISKSYGVPGLRLGILASQDKERLDRIKKAVSIWNINSMAEFFMQILDKYKKYYEEALVELRKERERFYRKLCQIEGLKVYPSSANYFMCELVNGRKSEELSAELLEEQILIKDLTGKIANGRQYVRIAVRSRRENEQLAEALKIKFL